MKQFRSLLGAVGALALCLSLTGCDFTASNPESLMRPPRLTTLQTQIDEALKNALGTQDIILKYPLSGEYRSAYLMHNLDADPQEEAIVFYRLPDEANSTIRISVLKQQADGSWGLSYTTSGNGTDIQSVYFSPISNIEQEDMIISWVQEGKESPTVMVYSYEEDHLSSIYSGSADSIYLADSNEDGYFEMLLLTKPSNRDPSVQLVRRVGRKLIAKSDAALNPLLVDFAGATFGKTADGRPAIFIDELLDSRTLATEVVVIENRRPVNLMASTSTGSSSSDEEGEEGVAGEEEEIEFTSSLYDATVRPIGVYSQDIDGDGAVEIPTQSLLPGYKADQEGEQLYLTTYNSINEKEFYPSVYAVRNEEMGYSILLPSQWQGNITVVKVHESGEWHFVVYDKSLENSTIELLRIRVSSHQDYHDKFETETYFSLAKKGIFEYYACIPTANHPLSITQEDVQEMFQLNRGAND